MRFSILVLPAALLISGAAMAQGGSQPMSSAASNLEGQPQATPKFAPSLPTPAVTGDRPSDFLRAAQGSLAAGRTGEAQQAMEMAQTRLLDRSVPLGQTNVPSDNPAVRQVSMALQALGAGDRSGSMKALEQALASAVAQGM